MSTSVRVGQTLPDTQNQEAPLGSVYIPELSVDKLTSGEISAATITMGDDGRILIGGDTKIELNNMGLFATKDGQPIFKLDKDGVEVTGRVNALSGTFSGALSSATIDSSDIVGSRIQGGTISIGNGNSVFLASGLGISVGNGSFLGSPFRVSADGTLVATNAAIQGTITGSTIIGSTITAGENGAFTVNALGQMSATGATITGTLRTAATGPRILMSHNGLLDGGVGQLQFWTGVSGETPAGIYATNQAGAGYKKIFSMTTGRDGATGYAGPALIMTVADAPAGGQEARVNFEFDQLYLNGTVTIAGNVAQNLFAYYANTTNFSDYEASETGTFQRVRFFKDSHNRVHMNGLAKTGATQIAANSVLATLPLGYRPKQRQLKWIAAGAPPVLRRVDILPNGQIINDTNALETGQYYSFNFSFPTTDY